MISEQPLDMTKPDMEHSLSSSQHSPSSLGYSLSSQGHSPPSDGHSPKSTGSPPNSLAHSLKIMGNSQLCLENSQENIGLSMERSPPPFTKPRTISDPKDFFAKLYGPDDRKQTKSPTQVL